MTTTTASTTTTATAVDRFLGALQAADLPGATDVYSADAALDATVPGWRFAVNGDEAVRAEYARWFAHPAQLEELLRHATPSGEVVEYTMTWVEDGVPHAAHHVHVLTIARDVDRITSDHCWCGGRWAAPLLAEMAAAAPAEQVAEQVAG